MTKSLTAKRNPFFLPSGFEPQEQINILEAKGENKKRLDKIKKRKQAEKKSQKQAKLAKNLPKLLKEKEVDTSDLITPIQRGLDLAKKWGWNGINRTYHPKIISVFGGRKRKNK